LEKKQVVVIGAGFAGLAAAALLAKKGLELLVLEQSGGAGGRARGSSKDGYILDYGPHSFRYAEKSSAAQILATLGESVEWLKEEHRSWLIKGKELYPVPGGTEKLSADQKKFFHRPEIEKVKNCLTKLILEAPEKWYRKTLADFCGEVLKDDKALLLVRLLGLQLMEPDPGRCSAGEMLMHLRRAYDAGVVSAQLKGGAGVLIEKMLSAITTGGGQINYHRRALALNIEKGRVVSVDTSQGELEPEALVYAGGLNQFLRIAGAEHFPAKWVRKLKRLEPVSGVAMDFGLREKVSELMGWLIEPELGIMGKFPSNLDPSLAPANKQLSSWLIMMPWEKIMDPEAVRLNIHKLRSTIKRVFPDFFALAEWERILVMPVMDGAALTTRQCLPERPEMQAPSVVNLFFAGDAVAVPGVSGEIALRSGIEVSEKCAEFLSGK